MRDSIGGVLLLLAFSVAVLIPILYYGNRALQRDEQPCTEAGGVRVKQHRGYVCIRADIIITKEE